VVKLYEVLSFSRDTSVIRSMRNIMLIGVVRVVNVVRDIRVLRVIRVMRVIRLIRVILDARNIRIICMSSHPNKSNVVILYELTPKPRLYCISV
jgi:hypothetical protein